MKVGQIFPLPADILYELGHVGKLKNETETKVLAKYRVVAPCSCGATLLDQDDIDKHSIKGHTNGELKGRVIVTYGHRRRKV